MEYEWKFVLGKKNSLKNKLKWFLSKYFWKFKINFEMGRTTSTFKDKEATITLFLPTIQLYANISNKSYQEILGNVIEEEIVHSLISYPETKKLHALKEFEITNIDMTKKIEKMLSEFLC